MNRELTGCPPDKRKYVLLVAIIASGMGFIDANVVAVAIPQIRSSLGASFAEAQWVHNAYILFLSALMLLGGAAGDRFGMKRVFFWGIAFFSFASALCAFAPNPTTLIAFRALQGAGAAIMIPGSMAIISVNTPRAERGQALGIWIASSSITAALGPALGGLLLTYGGPEAWRWIFAINVPLGVLAMALLRFQVPDDPPRQKRALDFLGAVLIVAALGMLATGLTWLGEADGTAVAWSLILAGIVLSAAAILFELRVRDPMIDLGLFRSRAFAGANLLTLLVWTGFSGILFFLPMVLIVAWQLPPGYAGAIFLPFSLIIAGLAPLSGRAVDRFGAKLLLTIGSVVMTLAHLAIAWAIAVQDYWFGILPAFAVLGLGLGLLASPLSTAIMISVDDESAGAASGINNMIARMSNLLAIAGLGAFVAYVYAQVVYGSQLHADVQHLMVDAGFGERLTGALYQISTQEVQAIAMNHAMIALCLVAAIMSLAGAVVGWVTQSTDSELVKKSV